MGTIYQNNGYWYYQTYVVQSDGKRVRKQFSLHTRDEGTARRVQVEWDRKVSHGLFSSPRFEFDKVVDNFLKEREWLVKHGDLNENTLRSDKGSFKEFRRFLSKLPQPLYVDQFDGESGEKIISEYIEYRRNNKISPNTIRRDLRHVSVLFTSLQKRRSSEKGPRLTINPFTSLTLPKPTKRKDFPDQSDWITLRDYLRRCVSQEPYDLFKTLIHIQIETGCRISEVLTLKWEQGEEDKTIGGGHSFSYLSENFHQCTIYSKRRERTIPIDRMGMTEVIKEIPRLPDSIYVFENPQTRRPYLASSASKMFSRLLDQLEVEGVKIKKRFTTHGNRHGFCSFCLNHGISPYQVGQIVGHSTSQITELYGHPDHETLGAVFKLLRDESVKPKTSSGKKKLSPRLDKTLTKKIVKK